MSFAIVRYWISDLLPSLIAAVAATVIPWLVLNLKKNQRMKKFDQSLPDALDLMSRSLRAGHSMGAAIEIVAEEGTEPLRPSSPVCISNRHSDCPIVMLFCSWEAACPQPTCRW